MWPFCRILLSPAHLLFEGVGDISAALPNGVGEVVAGAASIRLLLGHIVAAVVLPALLQLGKQTSK